MTELEGIAGLALVLLGGGLIAGLTYLINRRSMKITLRHIPAFQRLKRAVGLAVENGDRVHISIGKASLLDTTNASALVGLRALERIAEISMASDRPLIATSGDGSLSILSQDTLREVYRSGNAASQYSPQHGRLGGVTPYSYITGALPVIHDERVSANIFIGSFGSEVAFLNEAAERENAFVMAASDALPAQAVLFGIAQEPLIGEELFAVPAYLQTSTVHQASVHTQDILRWIVVLIILTGALLKLLGVV